MYLGANIQVVEYVSENKCWSMSPEKYVKMVIETVEAKQKKNN